MKKKKILMVGILLGICLLVGILAENYMFKQSIRESIDEAWEETNQEGMPEYLQKIAQDSVYEIIRIEKGDICVVSVNVRGIDLANELKKVDLQDLPQMDDEQEMNDYLIDLIEKSAVVETETNVYVEETQEGFDVVFSDIFVDAMCGKLYTYSIEMMEEILGE